MGTTPRLKLVLSAAGLKAQLLHRAAYPPLPLARGDATWSALDTPLTAAVAPVFRITSRRRPSVLTLPMSADSPEDTTGSLSLAGSALRLAVVDASASKCATASCCTIACMLARRALFIPSALWQGARLDVRVCMLQWSLAVKHAQCRVVDDVWSSHLPVAVTILLLCGWYDPCPRTRCR